MSSSDSQYSSDSSDSNFELRGKRKSHTIRNGNFQKNYPKNILTSIIAALEHYNYEQILIDKGISGKEIQKKNSASINLIHEILTHQLINSFNKHYLELLTSNILLQNSKISKKAFHLLQIKQAFSFASDVPLSQFRLEMSQMAKINSLKNYSNLQFFQFQSSTMYLLTLFCKVMQGNPNINDEIVESRESTEEQITNHLKSNVYQENNGKKSRDVLKPSIRELSLKLNSSFWDKEKYDSIITFIEESIANTEQKLVQNLNLKPEMAYLKLFVPEVVVKCFEKLLRGQKITMTILDSWVKQYQKKSLDCISKQVVFDKSLIDNDWKSKIKDKMPQKFSRKIKKQIKINKFSPIVLTPPLRNFNKYA